VLPSLLSERWEHCIRFQVLMRELMAA